MKKIFFFLNSFERYLSYFFTVVMVCSLFLQVVSRYVFKYSIVWTEELAIICFILSVYTGASLAITRRQHLKVRLLHAKVKKRTAIIMDLISNFIFGLSVFLIGNGMYVVIANLHKYHVKYVATGISKYLIYGTINFMFYVMIIRLIQDSIKLFKEDLIPGVSK